jgi:hypothetical protein
MMSTRDDWVTGWRGSESLFLAILDTGIYEPIEEITGNYYGGGIIFLKTKETVCLRK